MGYYSCELIDSRIIYRTWVPTNQPCKDANANRGGRLKRDSGDSKQVSIY